MAETAGTVELKFNPESGKFEKAELQASTGTAAGGELERNIITDLPVIPAIGGLAIAGLGDVASGMITDAIFPPDPDADPDEPPSDTKTLTDAGILTVLAIIPQVPQIKKINPGIANATSLILLADAITKVLDIRGLISSFGDPEPDPLARRRVNNRWLLAFGRRGPRRRRGRGDSRVRTGAGGGKVIEMATKQITQVGAGGGRGAARILGGGLGAPTRPNFPVERESRTALVGF